MGRLLPVLTVREFSNQATCYAGPNGRDRPKADSAVNLIPMGQTMARTHTRIVLLLPIFASILACSYETRHVQYSLSARPMNKDEAALMRTAINDFAIARGFSTFTEAGMAAHLQANGSYLYSFRSPDKSYISVINVVDARCYDIGVHSNEGTATARALGERLRQILRSTVSTEVTAESACNAKN